MVGRRNEKVEKTKKLLNFFIELNRLSEEMKKFGNFTFFFILLNSLLSESRSGAPKKGTQGTGVRQKPCYLPSLLNFFFHLNWTHCWSAAGQLKEWGNTFFFRLLFLNCRRRPAEWKSFRKNHFFFIELNCRRGRAEWKKKGCELHCTMIIAWKLGVSNNRKLQISPKCESYFFVDFA